MKALRKARPVQYEEKPASLGKKIAIISAVVVLGLGGLVVAFVISTAVDAGNYCSQKEAAIEKQGVALQKQLADVRVNGQSPSSSGHAADGDCLTGTSGSGIATFTVAFPSVAEAHAATAKALNLDDNTVVDYTQDDDNSGRQRETGIRAAFKKDGVAYTATYSFGRPQQCQEYDCARSTSNLQDFALASQPVTEIQIYVQGQPQN